MRTSGTSLLGRHLSKKPRNEALLCLLMLLLNFGPNLGTYVLPALCFPVAIRSTCHGLSSTGGSLGVGIATCWVQEDWRLHWHHPLRSHL